MIIDNVKILNKFIWKCDKLNNWNYFEDMWRFVFNNRKYEGVL